MPSPSSVVSDDKTVKLPKANKVLTLSRRRLAEVRFFAGMNQPQLAEAVGYSKQTISAWEQGTRQPSPEAFKRLAEVLGCEMTDLAVDNEDGAAA